MELYLNCTCPFQSVSTIICWCKIWWRHLRPILFGTEWLCYKVDNIVFLEWKLKCGTQTGYVKCHSAQTSLSTAIPTTHSPGMHMSSWGTPGKVHPCQRLSRLSSLSTTHSPGMHMSSWGTPGKVHPCQRLFPQPTHLACTCHRGRQVKYIPVYSYPHNPLTWHAHHHGGQQVKYIPVKGYPHNPLTWHAHVIIGDIR